MKKVFFELYFLSLYSIDSDEDLREWNDKFGVTIASLEDKVQKLTREIEDIETKGSVSQKRINDYTKKVIKLQTEAEVYILILHWY